MSDVAPEYIAMLMCHRSCATIESVINQATNMARFKCSEKIQLSRFVEANREFLGNLARELAEKKLLTMYDIQRIKNKSNIKRS